MKTIPISDVLMVYNEISLYFSFLKRTKAQVFDVFDVFDIFVEINICSLYVGQKC